MMKVSPIVAVCALLGLSSATPTSCQADGAQEALSFAYMVGTNLATESKSFANM